MPSLLETSIKISLLLRSFLPLDYYLRRRREIGWLIGIRDAYVKDTRGLLLIQSVYEEIAAIKPLPIDVD